MLLYVCPFTANIKEKKEDKLYTVIYKHKHDKSLFPQLLYYAHAHNGRWVICFGINVCLVLAMGHVMGVYHSETQAGAVIGLTNPLKTPEQIDFV